MKNSKKKNGIIFGSTGFLGKRLTIKLAKKDVNLILHGRSIKKLSNLNDLIKDEMKNVVLFPADITKKHFAENLLTTIHSKFKKIDFIVNLTGLFYGLRPLTHLSHKEWDNLIEINLSSHWRILKELEPLMRKSSSSKIVLLSNKEISSGKAYHNTFSICESARNAMNNLIEQENKKLNIQTSLIQIEKLNYGISSSLAGSQSLNENMLEEVLEKILEECL